MRLLYAFLIFTFLLSACKGNHQTASEPANVKSKIVTQAVTLAKEYASKQLKDPKINTAKDGTVVLSDNQKAFIIYPARVYTGLINDDSDDDAIVALDCFVGQYQVTSMLLFMLSENKNISLNTEIESDSKIISIKDRIITAEIHTHSRNSPLFNCSSCLEVVKYRFRNDELVKAE